MPTCVEAVSSSLRNAHSLRVLDGKTKIDWVSKILWFSSFLALREHMRSPGMCFINILYSDKKNDSRQLNLNLVQPLPSKSAHFAAWIFLNTLAFLFYSVSGNPNSAAIWLEKKVHAEGFFICDSVFFSEYGTRGPWTSTPAMVRVEDSELMGNHFYLQKYSKPV